MSEPSDQRDIGSIRDAAARFEAPGNFVLAASHDQQIVYLGESWEDVLGSPIDTALGSSLDDVVANAGLTAINLASPDHEWLSLSAAVRGSLVGLYRAIPLPGQDDGSGACVLEGQCFQPFENESIRVFIFRDETPRWEAVSSLDANERRFRAVADASRDMVTETDSEGRFTYASAACEQVLGYKPDELIGTRALDLHHPDDVDRFLAELAAGARTNQPFTVQPHRLRRRDGELIWAEALGFIYRDGTGARKTVGLARDVTAQVEAEAVQRNLDARVLRAQKLESLGILAGGIAHDFNNLLTPIIGNVGLALLDLPANSPIRRRIEMIGSAANRAAALTRQILTYADHGVPSVNAVNLSTTIEEMELLLESSASSTSTISYELQQDLPYIEVDRAHIGQVVMNLVANSSESFGTERGTIEVRTGSMHADQAYLDSCFIGDKRKLEKGEYVYLEVSDNGSGVAVDHLTQIFDPFFTTRFTGRGLGLAAVDGIVRGYNGALELLSVVGQGTRMRVLFPVPEASLVAIATDRRDEGEADTDTIEEPMRGTILVVDDDENACELMATVLERADFKVIQASGGAPAVKLFERHMDSIVGVVLDYTMPLVSGAEVYDSIRTLREDTRVILVSGYAQARAADDLMKRGLAGFLQKPFSPEDLVQKVDEMLEAPPRD